MKTISPSPESAAVRRAVFGRRTRLTLLALSLLAIVVAFSFWLADRWKHVYLNDARVAANVIALSSEVAGRVSKVEVIAGDRVKKGDLLLAIDSERARFELREVEAQLVRTDAAQSELRAQQQMIRRQVASRTDAALSQITGAQADERASTADVERARGDYERMKMLFDKGMVAAQRLDDSSTGFTAAQQRRLRAASTIETARANASVVRADEEQIAVLERRIATFAADRAALAAKLSQLQVDLEKREIRAAFDGVIDQTFIDPGEFVSPGTRLLMYHDPASLWVEANVKETEISRVKQGAPANIIVDAYPGREFRGAVVRIGSAATSQFALLPTPNPSGNFTKITQRVPIRVSLKQEDGALRPGMMVEVEIDVVD